MAGNRTPVSRVTGGDTHHYTTTDFLFAWTIKNVTINYSIFLHSCEVKLNAIINHLLTEGEKWSNIGHFLKSYSSKDGVACLLKSHVSWNHFYHKLTKPRISLKIIAIHLYHFILLHLFLSNHHRVHIFFRIYSLLPIIQTTYFHFHFHLRQSRVKSWCLMVWVSDQVGLVCLFIISVTRVSKYRNRSIIVRKQKKTPINVKNRSRRK